MRLKSKNPNPARFSPEFLEAEQATQALEGKYQTALANAAYFKSARGLERAQEDPAFAAEVVSDLAELPELKKASEEAWKALAILRAAEMKAAGY